MSWLYHNALREAGELLTWPWCPVLNVRQSSEASYSVHSALFFLSRKYLGLWLVDFENTFLLTLS